MNNQKIRILLIGDTQVGKTSIINRVVNRSFIKRTPHTTTCYFNYMYYKYNKKEIIKNENDKPILQGEIISSQYYLIELIDT